MTIDPLIVVASLAASAVTAVLFLTANSKPAAAKAVCNPSIKKDQAKVVDGYTLTDIEDMVKKSDKGVVAFCRCWRSSKFPLCDGAHNTYNKECGDNTGPLLIKKS